jgi:hypothetical protein
MADDTITETTTEKDVETVPEAEKAAPTEVPAEVKAALRKANKEAETLRLRLKEIEDRDKTEAQRLAERAEAAERAATEHAAQLARYKVAAETSVPADLLAGTDERSISEHAAALLAWRDSTAPVSSRPSGDVDQGVRTTPHALNGDPLLNDLKNTLGIR